jgi:hypothetical protein
VDTRPISPTGDPTLDKLLPSAERLVRAAHLPRARWLSDVAFADAHRITGDSLTAARSLAVLLAAMCPDDQAVELLSWRRHPTEYRRLRALGVPAAEARALAARLADNLAADAIRGGLSA